MKNSLQYSPDVYRDEKATGIRLPNGAKPLAKLSPKHLDMLRLHLEGMKNCDIAVLHGCTDATVSLTLNDPRMVELKKQHKQNVSNEFDALYGGVVDTIRDGLQVTQPMNVRLKSADMFLKESPMRRTEESERDTAEDVVKRLLEISLNVNVNATGTQPVEGMTIEGEALPGQATAKLPTQTGFLGEADKPRTHGESI